MIKKLQEKRARLYNELVTLNEQMAGKAEDAESRAKFDQLAADIEAVDAEIRREQTRLTLTAERAEEPKDVNKRASQALRKVLLGQPLTAEEAGMVERRDAFTGVDGTNILPTTVAKRIEAALRNVGGFVSAAGQIWTSTGAPMNFPTTNNVAAKGQWLAEYAPTPEGVVNFTPNTLGAHTLSSKLIPISLELIQDAEFDIISFIEDELANGLAAGLNLAITTGNGSGKPLGIVKSAFKVAGGSTVTFDSLMDLKAGVNSAYWKASKFMMNPKTFVALRKIKGNDGQYIWSNIAGSVVPMIDGHEVILNSDLDDLGATGGMTPILFGDFTRYKLRMVKAINFSVLRELYAQYRAVGIYGFLRADGKLLDAGTHPVAKLVQPGDSSSSSI